MLESFQNTFLTQSHRDAVIEFLSSSRITDNLTSTQSDDLQQFKNKLKKITFKNNFETYTSLAFYRRIRNIASFGKCLVIAHDTSLLQPLIDHMQYDLNETYNIDFCNIGNEYLPKKDDINYLRLEQINALNKKNFIVIGADNFRMIFRVMLVTLQTLEVGGQMHLTLPTMCEQYMFSMMHEIFNLFETHESYGATYVCQEDRTLSNDMCAMTGFRGLTQNILELLTKLNGLGDTSIDCIGCTIMAQKNIETGSHKRLIDKLRHC